MADCGAARAGSAASPNKASGNRIIRGMSLVVPPSPPSSTLPADRDGDAPKVPVINGAVSSSLSLTFLLSISVSDGVGLCDNASSCR